MTVLSVRLAGSFETTGRLRSSFSCLWVTGDLDRGGDGDCSRGWGVGLVSGAMVRSFFTGDLDLGGDCDCSLGGGGTRGGDGSREMLGDGDWSLDCVAGEPKTVVSESLSVCSS